MNFDQPLYNGFDDVGFSTSLFVYNIGSYPVFIVFVNETVVNRWDGADRGKLEATFERLGKGSKFKKKRGGKSR